MHHYIFPNGSYLTALLATEIASKETLTLLLRKLGANITQEEKVTVMIIAKSSFESYDHVFSLGEDCERRFGRLIDPQKLRIIIVQNAEKAKDHPLLERTSFIYVPGVDLSGAKEYPELEGLLPFLPKPTE